MPSSCRPRPHGFRQPCQGHQALCPAPWLYSSLRRQPMWCACGAALTRSTKLRCRLRSSARCRRGSWTSRSRCGIRCMRKCACRCPDLAMCTSVAVHMLCSCVPCERSGRLNPAPSLPFGFLLPQRFQRALNVDSVNLELPAIRVRRQLCCDRTAAYLATRQPPFPEGYPSCRAHGCCTRRCCAPYPRATAARRTWTRTPWRCRWTTCSRAARSSARPTPCRAAAPRSGADSWSCPKPPR
jgi:hypothetical protein